MSDTTPLILLHGALGTAGQLNKLKTRLEGPFEVHSLNFPGHGGRMLDEPYSFSLFSKDVVDFMDRENISEAYFFGYSMGGYVALNIAAEYPDRVKKIFTLGTKFDWNPEFASQEVKLLQPGVIEEKVPAFADSLKKNHNPLGWEWVLEKTADLLSDLGNKKLLDKEKLNSIENPVCIGIGLKDDTVGVDESRWAADTLPNGELKTFKDFPHAIQKTDPGLLIESIREFFRETLPEPEEN